MHDNMKARAAKKELSFYTCDHGLARKIAEGKSLVRIEVERRKR